MSRLPIYAGVGSRKTTPDVLEIMEFAGGFLADNWILRSGYADGADMAFGRGAEAKGGSFEMYLPWAGFNSAPRSDPRFIVGTECSGKEEARRLASEIHPAWENCSEAAKLLHTRNIFQVLGPDIQTPVRCVICWTPEGKTVGGTATAIRVAQLFDIPIFNLALNEHRHALQDFVINEEIPF